MCNFFAIKIDEVVKLGGGDAHCYNCDADLEYLIEQISWIYKGHIGFYDWFLPTEEVRCHSCGEIVLGYSQYCGSMAKEFIEELVTTKIGE